MLNPAVGNAGGSGGARRLAGGDLARHLAGQGFEDRRRRFGVADATAVLTGLALAWRRLVMPLLRRDAN